MVQIRLNIRGRRSNYHWFRLKVKRPSRRTGINVSVRIPPRRNVSTAQPLRSEYIRNVIFPRQTEPDNIDLRQPEYIPNVIYPRQNIIYPPQNEHIPHYYPEYGYLDGWGWTYYIPIVPTYELPPEPASNPVPQPAPVRDPSTLFPWEQGYVPKPSKYDPAIVSTNSYVENFIHWKTELLKRKDKLLKRKSKFEQFMGIYLHRSRQLERMNNKNPEAPAPTKGKHEPVYVLIPSPSPSTLGEESVFSVSSPGAPDGESVAVTPPGVETVLGDADVPEPLQSQGGPMDITVQNTLGITD